MYAQLTPITHRSALEKQATFCSQFTPIVGIEEADLPECILLDIAGCAHLFGGERKMADRVVSEFGRRDLVARVAIADTIGAAWAIAHHAEENASVIPAGRHQEAIQALPIEALRIPTLAASRLRQLDIHTIGRLQELPRQCLPSRFGVRLVQRLDQALGQTPELIPPVAPPAPVQAARGFLYPTTDRHILEVTIRSLIEEVTAQASERNRGVQHLTCRLLGEEWERTEMTVRVLQPTVSPDRLLELLRLQLDETRIAGDVSRIHVQAAVDAVEVSQWTLFDDADRQERRRELRLLIERLSSRLGPHAVVQPQWSRNPLPEFAVGYASAIERRPARGLAPPALTHERHRPTRLARQPTPIAVMSIVPDGPPMRFSRRGEMHTIARSWGPERIETGWWRHKHVRRDYYRVETETGERLWLFRRLRDGRWFLHGTFA